MLKNRRQGTIIVVVLVLCFSLATLLVFLDMVDVHKDRKNVNYKGTKLEFGRGTFMDQQMKEYAKAANERARELDGIPLIEPESFDTTRWIGD